MGLLNLLNKSQTTAELFQVDEFQCCGFIFTFIRRKTTAEKGNKTNSNNNSSSRKKGSEKPSVTRTIEQAQSATVADTAKSC